MTGEYSYYRRGAIADDGARNLFIVWSPNFQGVYVPAFISTDANEADQALRDLSSFGGSFFGKPRAYTYSSTGYYTAPMQQALPAPRPQSDPFVNTKGGPPRNGLDGLKGR